MNFVDKEISGCCAESFLWAENDNSVVDGGGEVHEPDVGHGVQDGLGLLGLHREPVTHRRSFLGLLGK